ncbi:MAG: OmpA family protein [Myxococcota bacterium]
MAMEAMESKGRMARGGIEAMRGSFIWLAIAGILPLLLAPACARSPAPRELLETRARYEAATLDPSRVANAPVEFLRARRAVEHAEAVWRSDDDADEVRHLARVADHRTQVAVAGAEANAARMQSERLSAAVSDSRERAVEALVSNTPPRDSTGRTRLDRSPTRAASGSSSSTDRLVEALLAIEAHRAYVERVRDDLDDRAAAEWGGPAYSEATSRRGERGSFERREAVRAEERALEQLEGLRTAAEAARRKTEEIADLGERLERRRDAIDASQRALGERLDEVAGALEDAHASEQARLAATRDVLDEARSLRSDLVRQASERRIDGLAGPPVAVAATAATRARATETEHASAADTSETSDQADAVRAARVSLERQHLAEAAERQTNEVLLREEQEARRTLETLAQARRDSTPSSAAPAPTLAPAPSSDSSASASTRELADSLRDRQDRIEGLVAENERLRASNDRLLAAVADARAAPPPVSAAPPAEADAAKRQASSRPTQRPAGSADRVAPRSEDASPQPRGASEPGDGDRAAATRASDDENGSRHAGASTAAEGGAQPQAAVERLGTLERERARLEAWHAQLVPGGVVVVLSDLFDPGDVEPNARGRAEVARLASLLMDMGDRKVRIEGHTDATGAAGFNQRLSEARARAVRDQLEQAGVAAARLESAGAGEAEPIAPNRTKAGRERNRRIEVTVYDAASGRS